VTKSSALDLRKKHRRHRVHSVERHRSHRVVSGLSERLVRKREDDGLDHVRGPGDIYVQLVQ
jgi:hypothetical protein